MESKNHQVDAPKSPYAPPKATFVPLKIEERLLACNKKTLPGLCSTPSTS